MDQFNSQPPRLRKLIEDKFSADTIQAIFFDFKEYGLDYENAPSGKKSRLVMFLLESIHDKFNREQIEEFRAYLKRERPNVVWDASFDQEFGQTLIIGPNDVGEKSTTLILDQQNSQADKERSEEKGGLRTGSTFKIGPIELSCSTYIVLLTAVVAVGAMLFTPSLMVGPGNASPTADAVAFVTATSTAVVEALATATSVQVLSNKTATPISILTSAPTATETAEPTVAASPTATATASQTPTATPFDPTSTPTAVNNIDPSELYKQIILTKDVNLYGGPSDQVNPILAILRMGSVYPILTRTQLNDYVSVFADGKVGWVKVTDVVIDGRLNLSEIPLDPIDGGEGPTPTAGPVSTISINIASTPDQPEGTRVIFNQDCPVFIDLSPNLAQTNGNADYIVSWRTNTLPQNVSFIKIIIENVESSGSRSQSVLNDSNLDLAQVLKGTFNVAPTDFEQMGFIAGDEFKLMMIVFDDAGNDLCEGEQVFTWNREGLPTKSD